MYLSLNAILNFLSVIFIIKLFKFESWENKLKIKLQKYNMYVYTNFWIYEYKMYLLIFSYIIYINKVFFKKKLSHL